MYNKYKNIHTTCPSGHKHRSKKEARYCSELSLRKRGKDISDYEVEVPFILQKSEKIKGETIRAIKYIADFVIHHNDGSKEVVDVKGYKENKVFLLKWKILKYIYRDDNNIKFTIT